MSVAFAYIDTSAFLRLFIDEGDSDEIWESVREIVTLYASRLVLTEARVTLARLNRGNRLSAEGCHDASLAISNFWEDEIVSTFLTEEMHQAAEGLATTHPLRSADALHLGTASEIRRTLPVGTPFGFVACDRDLIAAATKLGFTPLPKP